MKSIIAITLLFLIISCQSAYRITPDTFKNYLVHHPQPIQLIAADHSVHNFADIYKAHKAVVIVFWQIHCPCVKRYQERVEKLYQRYHKHDIAFMYISSNTNETFEEVKHEYQKRATSLPLLRDQGGALAKTAAARGTPAALLINRSGEIMYFGWIDNERKEKEVGRIPYLENAITQFLDNQPVTQNTSAMFGCPIK